MATKTKVWKTIAEMTEVSWEDGALSVVSTGSGHSIVRPTTDGRFAVIAVRGAKNKVVTILPTLDRARAYNRACGA
jgi:hypothetical protein